jgi:Tol biopolymer transport system component
MGVVRGFARACVVVLLLGGILSAREALPAFASFPGRDGVIAYPGSKEGNEGEESQIWAIDWASGYQLRLTSGPFDAHPSFSPTGEMLVFDRRSKYVDPRRLEPYPHHDAAIYVVNSDGSNPRFLTVGSEPAFGPNGREIVFVRHGDIYISSTNAGGRARRIVRGSGDSAPNWSVTGQIVFEHSRPTVRRNRQGTYRELIDELEVTRFPYHRVHTLLTFETGPAQHEEDEPTDFFPDWSPDGRRVVLQFCHTELKGVIPTRPTLVVHDSCGPEVWFPDGKGLFAVIGSATSSTGVKSTCPTSLDGLSELSYQPLHVGSSRVPVTPCHSVMEGSITGTAPSAVVNGSRTCYTLHHRRHCRIA